MNVITSNPFLIPNTPFRVFCSECDSEIEILSTDVFVDIRRDDVDRTTNDPPLVPTFKCPVCKAQADIIEPPIQKRVLRIWLKAQPT